jgi:hypothetical protein
LAEGGYVDISREGSRIVLTPKETTDRHPMGRGPIPKPCRASTVRRVTPRPRCLEIFMNRDPRFALSQELEAKQTLLDQLRALAADDPDFFTDLLEGETSLLELIAALDASIVADEILVDGAKAAQRRLLAHTPQQIGLKTLRTPTATLTLAEASLKAIAVAPKTFPRAGGSRSRRNSIRTGSPRRSARATRPSTRPRRAIAESW